MFVSFTFQMGGPRQKQFTNGVHPFARGMQDAPAICQTHLAWSIVLDSFLGAV